jgi:hypothetical protein
VDCSAPLEALRSSPFIASWWEWCSIRTEHHRDFPNRKSSCYYYASQDGYLFECADNLTKDSIYKSSIDSLAGKSEVPIFNILGQLLHGIQLQLVEASLHCFLEKVLLFIFSFDLICIIYAFLEQVDWLYRHEECGAFACSLLAIADAAMLVEHALTYFAGVLFIDHLDLFFVFDGNLFNRSEQGFFGLLFELLHQDFGFGELLIFNYGCYKEFSNKALLLN